MNRLPRALCALTGLSFAASCGKTRESEAAPAQAQVASRSTNVSASRRTAITEAVAHVAPAVVTVQTELLERVAPDPLDWPFGGGESQQRSAGLGTGFVMRPDGVIVTNAHVVAGATRVSVMMRDGKTFPAKILGADETNDLAVIKIDASGLPTAKLGNSENLLVGEWAIAIGNPYGFVLGNSEPSVTAGVISGTGRNLVARGEGSAAYFDMIQTDASINPGNSGGALVNLKGELIGINTAILSRSGGNIGIGFAIPVNMAHTVMDQLLKFGSVKRGLLGVSIYNVTPDIAQLYGLGDTPGALVSQVVEGSPADKAGIRTGDVITSVNGQNVKSNTELRNAIGMLRVGEKVDVGIVREGKPRRLTAVIADSGDEPAKEVTPQESHVIHSGLDGASLADAPQGAGALVRSVETGSTAAQAGLRANDVIIGVNRGKVTNLQQLRERSKGVSTLVLEVRRANRILLIPLR
jgi:Do/DeqQ family serine protease